MINLNEHQIKAICDVIAETNKGLTKSEITRILNNINIELISDNKCYKDYVYSVGMNKREWLYKCLICDSDKKRNTDSVFLFIEQALSPVLYTQVEKRGQYNYLMDEVNKILLLVGLGVNSSGKIYYTEIAKSLDEVDKKVNHMKKVLYERHIHMEVLKYCNKDLLRNDYYDSVFEASKGLAERVREITGLKTDGGTLFQTAFSTNDPYLFFNSLSTESERSEFCGLKELLCAIFHLVRNPTAHTPKINWKYDEQKAIDILTIISFAHYYLDNCNKMPGK